MLAQLSIFLIFAASFAMAFLVMPPLIRRMAARGITGKDMNKASKPEVAELGGIGPILGISFGIITAIFISTYTSALPLNLTILLASFLTIFLVCFIGVIDDVIGWRKGIRQWQHALFPVFAALPLMAVNAGTDFIVLPFLGSVSLGVLYSLILVPLAITGASNAFNMLAGFNGLEAGLGSIIIATLSLIAFLTGETEAAIIGVSVLAALLAFLFYNWYPARVFGGDSLTLMIGASIATISIVGNMEKLGLFIIALHWAELAFKARHMFQSQNFGIPQRDGRLAPDPRGGSLVHFVLRWRMMTEKRLVLTLLGAQAVVSAVVFGMFYFRLF